MSPTYKQLVINRLDEIKAMAATNKTYGDWWRLEEAIDEELVWIREMIHRSRADVRRARQRVNRWPDWEYAHLIVRRAKTILAFDQAVRDELKAGRTEMRKQDREERTVLQRLTKLVQPDNDRHAKPAR